MSTFQTSASATTLESISVLKGSYLGKKQGFFHSFEIKEVNMLCRHTHIYNAAQFSQTVYEKWVIDVTNNHVNIQPLHLHINSKQLDPS